MASKFDISRYAYHLPEELLARTPAVPRDASRLFVYDTTTDKISLDVFRNLTDYLPNRPLMVFNETKVVPARVFARKETGGKVELLLFINECQAGDKVFRGLADRQIDVGQKLYLDREQYLKVVGQEESIFSFQPNFSVKSLLAFLNRKGFMPVPKYIKNKNLSERQLRKKYQSVFAKNPSSVAAPTASLHFTDRVIKSLAENEIDTTVVSLNIGLGTFAPVKEENIRIGKLHEENFEIGTKSLLDLKRAKFGNRSIIAVGTTVVRTLESAAREILSGKSRNIESSTDLFIRPPYNFKIVDGLITNFHVPESSLMMLVDAFLKHKKSGRNVVDLYKVAIENRYRFFSFGDAMLIL